MAVYVERFIFSLRKVQRARYYPLYTSPLSYLAPCPFTYIQYNPASLSIQLCARLYQFTNNFAKAKYVAVAPRGPGPGLGSKLA